MIDVLSAKIPDAERDGIAEHGRGAAPIFTPCVEGTFLSNFWPCKRRQICVLPTRPLPRHELEIPDFALSAFQVFEVGAQSLQAGIA